MTVKFGLVIILMAAVINIITCQRTFIMKAFYSDPIGGDEWSRRHELGRAYAHRLMVNDRIDAHCEIFQSLDAYNATKKASELIESGHIDLISFTSGDFADTARNISLKYPHQKMLTAGTRPTNNSVNIAPRAYEGYYLGGVACGMVTKTNAIGYMALTPTSNTFGIINAIYAGMKKTNPNAVLYVTFTNDFYDPLLERKSAEYMVQHWNVDCGISQSVDANSMWANDIGIPVMGFISDMRYQVGENVMFSVTYTWDSFYHEVVRQILNGTFVGNRQISSGFDRIMTLTDFSTTTSNEIAIVITDLKNSIANNTYQIFCGDELTSIIKPRLSNSSCLTNNEIRLMNSYYSPILNIRNLTRDDIIEQVHVAYDSPLGIAVSVIASFIISLSIAFIIYVLVNREVGIITRSAYRFCVLVLGGVAIGAASTYFWIGYPTDSICMARVWLGGIAFSISCGGLFIKNYRIWRIFKEKSLSTKGTTDRQLILFGVLPLLAFECVVLVLWTTIDPMKVTVIEESPFLGETQIYIACKSESVWPVVVFLVSKGILLIFGVIVSYNTRDLSAKYTESKEIGWSIYNTILFGFLAVVANLIVSYNGMLEAAVITISIFVICLSIIGFVFVPKFWKISIKGMNEPNVRSIQTASTVSKSSSTKLPTLGSLSVESGARQETNRENGEGDESSV